MIDTIERTDLGNNVFATPTEIAGTIAPDSVSVFVENESNYLGEIRTPGLDYRRFMVNPSSFLTMQAFEDIATAGQFLRLLAEAIPTLRERAIAEAT